jgi:hypothetical protein
VTSRRLRGELPTTAPRIAQSAMQKRDHGLCVREFCSGIGSQVVAPGGKWAGWLHETLRQAGGKEARQPRAGGLAWPGPGPNLWSSRKQPKMRVL